MDDRRYAGGGGIAGSEVFFLKLITRAAAKALLDIGHPGRAHKKQAKIGSDSMPAS